jgi:hypothetical protein
MCVREIDRERKKKGKILCLRERGREKKVM